MVIARTFILRFLAASLCLAVAWGQSRKSADPHQTHTGAIPHSGKATPKPAFTSVPVFEDIASSAGLTVPHISSRDKRYVIESMSGGIGLFDCDNDGKLDIVMVNGSTVDRFREGGDPMITLWHQDADLKFSDITASAGLTVKGWGMGVAVADFDNDGRLDIFVTGYGRNVLYRNL